MNTVEKINKSREEKTEERLTIKSMWFELWQNLALLSKKAIIFTFLELILRPGFAIKKKISGYRNYLYSAFEYLLFSTALIVILNSQYHFYQNEYGKIADHFEIFNFNKKFISSFFIFAEKYAELVNFIAIPVFALLCRLFWPDKKYNFAEMLVANTYIAAQQMLFLVLLVPFIYLFPSAQFSYFMPFYFFISFMYNTWVYIQLFDGNMFVNLLKSLLAVTAGYIIQLPVNMLIYYILNPYTGLFELIK